jgi:hypothetical protein
MYWQRRVYLLRNRDPAFVLTIGIGFAQGENKALLAALIGSFEFKLLPSTSIKPEVVFGITARIIGGPPVATSIVEGW